MIPTWTDHAHEAGRHVRFARRNAVVSLLRYVAHLSATVQAGHHSAPQEPPMTTPEERHEADQDDADRVREWPAEDVQEPLPSVRTVTTVNSVYQINEADHTILHIEVTSLGDPAPVYVRVEPPMHESWRRA